MSPDTPRAVAAIDCGTNSTRLLIATVVDGRLTTSDRRMRITRLGRGVDATGRLDPDAVAHTLAVLAEYRAAMDEHGVDAVRVAATSAARDATDRDELFAAIEETVGVAPELLSGDEEARLSFLGATAELDPATGPFLVVDIGGGSTELAFGSAEVEQATSVDVGCVRMTEQFLHHDPPRPEELSSCLSVIEEYLKDAVRAVPGATEAAVLVGLAGTVSTAAAVELGLATYDRDALHHFVLTKAAAEDVFRTLATEALADRVHNPGLERGRADVIVGGLCVLVQLLRQLGYGELLVSESDILDGLALGAARSTEPR